MWLADSALVKCEVVSTACMRMHLVAELLDHFGSPAAMDGSSVYLVSPLQLDDNHLHR